MKYLYILANAFTALTGGDRHFIEIAKRRKGVDGLNIVLMIPESAKEVCDKEGVHADYMIIPPKNTKRLGIVLTYILRTLFALIKVPKFKKDILVYSSSDCLPDVLPALFAKFLNKNTKWISCSFHLVPHYSRRQGSRIKNILSYYAQRLSIFFIKMANLVIVDNSIIKNELKNMGISEENIFISSMGVDKVYIDSVKEEGRICDGCFVGRLHPAKGIFDLISIWHMVTRKRDGARLAIVGKGDKDIIDRLNGKIKDLGMFNNIDLLGFLEKDDMFRIIKSSKVFIFPSHEEGWGIAIAEAMACGLPAVIYDLPALKEVFPVGAIRVRLGDIDSFSDAVVSLLTDSQRYNKLQLETREIANRYSWDNVARREWEEICRICNEKI